MNYFLNLKSKNQKINSGRIDETNLLENINKYSMKEFKNKENLTNFEFLESTTSIKKNKENNIFLNDECKINNITSNFPLQSTKKQYQF